MISLLLADFSASNEKIVNAFSRYEIDDLTRRNGTAGRSTPSSRGPRSEGAEAGESFHVAIDRELMGLGREDLLMREADVQKQMVTTSNNRERVGLTSIELSHLHQQLHPEPPGPAAAE